ncbi:MAG: hypothetical protein KBG48_01900 [Kofleriaceae bacterium]|jgi:hypothetical protein|nr:hypothetical protein [Kofleriaceae bacterium]MBP9166101.1 hypothetical protein [Kofleriaceae bacterium]MBP9856931.1 hypothetical protein [Kofleriaceae bacterium]
MPLVRVAGAAALALAACRGGAPRGDGPAATPSPGSSSACAAAPFAAEVPVAEASGAAWLPTVERLLIVADSGHRGAFVEVDRVGAVVARGQLPLGDGGDDLEGLALDGDRVWGVTSSGWAGAWRRGPDGYALVDAVALDPRCPSASVNCGDNYEGLCLASAPLADGCDGYLAAKTSGALVCVVRRDGRLALAPERRHVVAKPERLADCAIASDGTVWTGDNGFGLAAVRQWAIGADGARLIGESALGLGFPEVLALGPDATVYRLSDLGGAPSLALAFRCPGGLPKAGPAAPGE